MDMAGVGGLPLTARDVSAGMAMATIAAEPNVEVVGFSTQLRTLDISERRRLDDVLNYLQRQSFGGTDCALPALWAREQGRDFDAITIYTDNETWAGRHGHPYQTLTKYRRQVGHRVSQVVVGITATPFTIADPADPDSLDVVGFDSAVPNMIADFAAGDI